MEDSNHNRIQNYPPWMKIVLQLAGIYNIIWGIWVLIMPDSFFAWTDMPLPNYPQIWQSVGMIVGVYGLGYYIAAYNPYRHWPVILVGFLGKLFGPAGAVFYAMQGSMDWQFLYINLTNDLIWLVPFAVILYRAWQYEPVRIKS